MRRSGSTSSSSGVEPDARALDERAGFDYVGERLARDCLDDHSSCRIVLKPRAPR